MLRSLDGIGFHEVDAFVSTTWPDPAAARQAEATLRVGARLGDLAQTRRAVDGSLVARLDGARLARLELSESDEEGVWVARLPWPGLEASGDGDLAALNALAAVLNRHLAADPAFQEEWREAPRRDGRRMTHDELEEHEAELAEAVTEVRSLLRELPSRLLLGVDGGSDRPVLVDCWAAWCGPCRSVTPIVKAVGDRLNGLIDVGYVDVDAVPEIKERYGVQTLPSLFLVMPDGGWHRLNVAGADDLTAEIRSVLTGRV